MLTPETAVWRMTNNCSESQNHERPGRMDPAACDISFKQEGGRLFLRLAGADGKGACYQKE